MTADEIDDENERLLDRPEARRVEPTVSLLEKGFVYVPAAHTNLHKRFDEIRASLLDFSGPSLRELKARKK